MSRRSIWFVAAVLLALPAPVLAATYRYEPRPMLLVPVEGGYFLDGNAEILPPRTYVSVEFWVHPRITAHSADWDQTLIVANVDPQFGNIDAVAYQGGRQIAVQDETSSYFGSGGKQNETTGSWFSISGPLNVFGISFWAVFDASSDVQAWGYSTGGESYAVSLGGPRDSYIVGPEFSWEPGSPEYLSDGPGTWVRSPAPDPVPAPVPVPATALLLLTAVVVCATLRSRRTVGRTVSL